MRGIQIIVLAIVAMVLGACKGAVVTKSVVCERGNSALDADCDGQDDDCDGETDEGFEPTSTQCGQGGCEASGETRCVNGKKVNSCRPGQKHDESCNNQDDDCDGQTDENVDRLCMVSCTSGREQCSAGRWGACDAPGPQAEVCGDGIDNDCNNITDDGCPPPAPKCGDGTCSEPTESCDSCPSDCDVCPTECGDGTCDTVQGESSQQCVVDCPEQCGNGYCGQAEDAGNCSIDCPATCGDKICSATESAKSCLDDCPVTCGDGVCTTSQDEDAGSCAKDCADECGDNICGVTENTCTCDDCTGACCGDEVCDADEGYETCPSDCKKPTCEADSDCGPTPVVGQFTLNWCHHWAEPRHCHGVVDCSQDASKCDDPELVGPYAGKTACQEPFPGFKACVLIE